MKTDYLDQFIQHERLDIAFHMIDETSDSPNPGSVTDSNSFFRVRDVYRSFASYIVHIAFVVKGIQYKGKPQS